MSKKTSPETSSSKDTTRKTVVSTLQKYRYNRSVRTIVLVVLLLIILALLFFRGKMKGLLIALLVLVLLALGIHIADYDLDIGTLIETGSFEESRVETKKGVKIIGSDCISDHLNCAHFATQPEAQQQYEYCAEKIAAANSHVDPTEIRRLDVYGLDGDKDGIVCEALPTA